MHIKGIISWALLIVVREGIKKIEKSCGHVRKRRGGGSIPCPQLNKFFSDAECSET